MAGQHQFLDRADVDQLFGIDHRRIRRQRHRAAGVAGAAAARDDGQAGFDAAAHQMADFFLAIWREDDEGVFDAPVGRIGDVRDTGQAVKGDVVATRVFAEDLKYLAAQVVSPFEMLGKAVDR